MRCKLLQAPIRQSVQVGVGGGGGGGVQAGGTRTLDICSLFAPNQVGVLKFENCEHVKANVTEEQNGH